MPSTSTYRLPLASLLSFLMAAYAAIAVAQDATDTGSTKNLQIVSPGSGSKPQAKTKAKPQAAPQAKPQANTEAKTEAKTEPKLAPASKAGTGAVTQDVSDAAKDAAASTAKAPEKAEQNATKVTNGLASVENWFGLSTYQHLGDGAPGKNLFISPYSLHSCLHLVFDGAAGNTMTEMAKVLGLSTADKTKENEEFVQLGQDIQPPSAEESAAFVFSVANSIWANSNITLKPDFLELSKRIFSAEVRSLDFSKPESASTINAWVRDRTHDKIPTIVDNLRGDQSLVALNAAYFKARWKTDFNKQWTKDADFKASSGTKKVSMMDGRGSFNYLENDQLQAVELPYFGGKTSMVVFLPREKSSLADLRHTLQVSNFDGWLNKMEMRPGEIFLPKFAMQYQVFCGDFLRAAGMKDAFDKAADFSEMIAPPSTARISEVLHKTFVKVDEEGTEAAAATAVVERALSLMVEQQPEPFKMVVDRPFFFAIVDWKTHAILFVGQVADPTES